MRPQEAHASAFVRVSGPVVNTVFFQKTWLQPGDCQVWAAPYMVDCCDCMSRLTTGGSLDQHARKLVTNRKTALRGLVPTEKVTAGEAARDCSVYTLQTRTTDKHYG